MPVALGVRPRARLRGRRPALSRHARALQRPGPDPRPRRDAARPSIRFPLEAREAGVRHCAGGHELVSGRGVVARMGESRARVADGARLHSPLQPVRHSYIGRNYIGRNCTGRNYIGHSYIGHNYIGHNYTGRNCIGL